jgi:ferrous iron transport protein A
MTLTLADIRAGQLAHVERVEGNDALSLRLLEMGLTPGCEVRYVGQAPWGDPLEFAVRGYRLSLRKAEAARVHVSTT